MDELEIYFRNRRSNLGLDVMVECGREKKEKDVWFCPVFGQSNCGGMKTFLERN